MMVTVKKISFLSRAYALRASRGGKPGPPFDPLSRLRSKFLRERSTPTPILRMQNASLSRSEESLVLSGVRGNHGFSDVAKQMRRLGGAGCQDVLVAADIDARSEAEGDFLA